MFSQPSCFQDNATDKSLHLKFVRKVKLVTFVGNHFLKFDM